MPSIVGVMSFTIGWGINPPDGYNTLLSGSPNYFVDGAAAMTAMIPGWWPDEVNMNWKITEAHKPVLFPEGMPFVFFTVVKDDLLPSVEFDVGNMWDNPDLMKSRQAYGEAKMKNMQDNPWTWMGSIRTGLNEKDESIGPKHEGHPILDTP